MKKRTNPKVEAMRDRSLMVESERQNHERNYSLNEQTRKDNTKDNADDLLNKGKDMIKGVVNAVNQLPPEEIIKLFAGALGYVALGGIVYTLETWFKHGEPNMTNIGKFERTLRRRLKSESEFEGINIKQLFSCINKVNKNSLNKMEIAFEELYTFDSNPELFKKGVNDVMTPIISKWKAYLAETLPGCMSINDEKQLKKLNSIIITELIKWGTANRQKATQSFIDRVRRKLKLR